MHSPEQCAELACLWAPARQAPLPRPRPRVRTWAVRPAGLCAAALQCACVQRCAQRPGPGGEECLRRVALGVEGWRQRGAVSCVVPALLLPPRLPGSLGRWSAVQSLAVRCTLAAPHSVRLPAQTQLQHFPVQTLTTTPHSPLSPACLPVAHAALAVSCCLAAARVTVRCGNSQRSSNGDLRTGTSHPSPQQHALGVRLRHPVGPPGRWCVASAACPACLPFVHLHNACERTPRPCAQVALRPRHRHGSTALPRFAQKQHR